jgi:C4-dicarboxylate-specific signal transduction histidine kinase
MLKVSALALRRQLLIAVALLLAPTLGAAAWLAIVTFRERVATLAGQSHALALQTALSFEREIRGYDRMTRSLAENPAVQSLDSEKMETLFHPTMVQRPSLIELALIDRSGRVVSRAMGSEAVSVRGREVIAPVLERGTRVISPMQVSASGVGYVTIGYPVRVGSGEIVGVLTCYVNPQLMEDTFRLMKLSEANVVTLTESGGRILARSLSPEKYVGQVIQTDHFSNSAQPVEYDDVDGVQRMHAAATIAGVPWRVTAGIPTSVAFDAAFSQWLRSFAILALGLAGWLGAGLVLSRRLTRSLSHLEAAAERIGAGDFSPLDRQPMATQEFAELQNAFDQMLRRFNETRAALDQQMAEERRMRQEVQSLQRQVIRQERLAAVGQLVSGVAHEINNPLQAILGFAELLQMQADLPANAKADLLLIQKESGRACGIIRNLALFARQQTGDAAPVRLADVITSVAELRQRRLESEDIELRIEDSSSQHVLAVLTELQQVVLNFVVNAEQAIVMSGRQPGCITIRTRDEGDRAILEVEDTGPGIPAELEARLFQPFFTTKPVGQGTGLGLSVSYGIIDSLGGHIGYRSAAAGGAIFHFDLPTAAAAVSRPM